MASKGPKKESLSRYFKDLDEFECSSDDEEEINNADNISGGKINSKASQKDSSSASPIGKTDRNKALPSSRDREADFGTTTTSTTANNEQKCPGAKGDADVTSKKGKLPSASDCLNTRSNPTFLKLLEKKDVNWDICQKRIDGGSDDVAVDFKSNAVPPPSSYEPMTDPGIKVVDSEGRKRKTIGDELEDQMTSTRAYKVHKDESEDGDDPS